MSVSRIDRWTLQARRRSALDDALAGAPLVVLAATAAGRLGGRPAAAGVAVLGMAVLTGASLMRSRRFDRTWIVRRLNGMRPELEDSSDLLTVDRAGLGPLQRLQYDRVQRRLAETAPDLRPAWSVRRIAIAWALAGLALLPLVLWPRVRPLALVHEGAPAPGAPGLVAQRLRVVPPAYTGLPPSDLVGLDGQVPQGSRLEWTLRFVPRPTEPALEVVQAQPLKLNPAGDDWRAGLTLDHSLLYRLAPQAGGPKGPLHRLDAIADAPPQVTVLRPAQGLTLVTPGQTTWSVAFEATDDYGVAPEASLRLTFAEGEGEQVKFRDRNLTLHGDGTGRRRRFTAVLDFASLGFKEGGDLIVQLVARDNRAPSPQTAAGPSLILRWPAKVETMGEGLDAAVKKDLPAYLRSERQILIDAHQLLSERRGLTAERFLARSDALGADQQGLRLRYSQFLGGESEKAENALPTSDDEDALPTKAAAPTASPVATGGFGADVDVLHNYGHAHDETESSAVDPGGQGDLKLSVDQMFQAETHLRQGDPAGALPFAEKALVFLKAAQQAERVYVPHASAQLPSVDESRRLTGKRDGLAGDDLALAPADASDPVPAAAWLALGDHRAAETAAVLSRLEDWLRTDAARGVDPLAFEAAIDAVRRDTACSTCRTSLRGLVWTALKPPPPHVARRQEADAEGRRYLEGLQGAPGR